MTFALSSVLILLLCPPPLTPNLPSYLLSEDDVVLYEVLGEHHGVLHVHVIVGGPVDEEEGAVRDILHLVHQARLPQ